MPLSAGDKLGPYEILSPIGAGGMGEVYKARDTRLDRSVAIKVLPEHIAKREDLRQRFEREARAVASLNHPNICTLHDIGAHEGAGYMVMEYMEGENLAARIERGALPLDQALNFAKQIADALDRAHRAAVTHRDVKPANIMLTRDGVKVLDFGLAKSSARPGPTDATLTNALTTEGTVMGTPQYMAPEQFEGREADARSDIWAFGAVLYEMVTGQKAFQGKNYSSLVGAILSAEPPAMSVKPLTPSWLERLVRRCLAKDPEDRWQSMRDIVLELRTPPSQERAAVVPAPRRPLPWILAGTTALLLGALAVVHFREPPPQQQQRLRWEVATDTPVQFLTLSPDGRQLAMVRDDNGVQKMHLRSLDSVETQPVLDTDGATYPFWSADSRHIGFFADGKLKRITPGGTRAQTICDAPNPRGGSWNREDIILFAPDISGPLYRVSAAGASPVAATKAGSGASHRYPAFIAGGRKFLFMAEGAAGVMAGDLDGAPPVSVLPKSATNVAYVPVAGGKTGVLLFRRDGALLAQAFDPTEMRASGEPIAVVDQVSQSGQARHGAFAASLNGILVYRKGSRFAERQLVWLSRTGVRLATAGPPGHFSDLNLSPDGTRIALTLRPLQGAFVWILDLGTGVFSRFTNGRYPVWAQKSTHLLYSTFGTDSSIFDLPINRKPADGGKEEILGRFGINAAPSDSSPDGKYLAYSVSGEKSNDDIWLLPLEGDRKPISFLTTAANESRAQFSPDGNWLVYESDESGRAEIWAQSVPPNGAKFQVSTAGGTQARWRRDGNELFYISGSGQLMAVSVKAGKSFERGVPRELFGSMPASPNPRGFSYQPSADGQRFVTMVPAGKEGGGAPPVTVMVNWMAELNR